MVLSVLTRLETYKFLSDPDTALVYARLMRGPRRWPRRGALP